MHTGDHQPDKVSNFLPSASGQAIGRMCRIVIAMLALVGFSFSVSKPKGLTAAPQESNTRPASIQLSKPVFGKLTTSETKASSGQVGESDPIVIQPRTVPGKTQPLILIAPQQQNPRFVSQSRTLAEPAQQTAEPAGIDELPPFTPPGFEYPTESSSQPAPRASVTTETAPRDERPISLYPEGKGGQSLEVGQPQPAATASPQVPSPTETTVLTPSIDLNTPANASPIRTPNPTESGTTSVAPAMEDFPVFPRAETVPTVPQPKNQNTPNAASQLAPLTLPAPTAMPDPTAVPMVPEPTQTPMMLDSTGSYPVIPELESLYREQQQQPPTNSSQNFGDPNQSQIVPEMFVPPTHRQGPPIYVDERPGSSPQSGHALDNTVNGTGLGMSHGHSITGAFPGTSGYRATVEADASEWMSPYVNRANTTGSESMTMIVQGIASLPPNYQPWWDSAVRQPTGMAASTLPVDISSLLHDAMLYSPQVLAIKTEPEVQRRVITQEAAKFDWTAFLETTYDNLNDPAGNSLATGNGTDRLLTQKLYAAGGIRRRTLTGGDLRLAQEIGHENQNSRIFLPNNQGSSRLELSYRQPLWDGAGRSYNESEIILARIQANASEDEVVGALQDHLIEVTEAYWTLYRSRAEFFQRQKLLESAKGVLLRLEGRSQVDTIPRQVLRARAAVARAQTRIQRTIARVKDSEAQLRLLVNSPGMLNGGPTELTPNEPPRMVTEASELQSVLQTALINRPDISEAIRKMRASSVRLGVSQNEILPRLDFIVETYIADLAGNSDIPLALRGQWTDNRPGYTVGLEFEVPIENRAAIAKMEQRQWELKRSINVFKATVEKSLTDVEIANREVATAYSEMLSRYQSMKAAEDESLYLKDRFEVLPASEDSATLLLEDLLDSFERLADEETSFVQSQVDHAIAIIRLKKEIGILLQSRHDRPNITPEDHAWVNERIQSAVERTQDPEISEAAITTDRSPAAFGTTGHVISSERSENVVRPMPITPTQWSRVGTSAGGYSIR